jgi:hypothetical protein
MVRVLPIGHPAPVPTEDDIASYADALVAVIGAMRFHRATRADALEILRLCER